MGTIFLTSPRIGDYENEMQLGHWISETKPHQGDLAKSIGVSRQALHRYASGEREPDAVIRNKIVEVTHGAVTIQDQHKTRLDWLKAKQEARSAAPATGTQESEAAQ